MRVNSTTGGRALGVQIRLSHGSLGLAGGVGLAAVALAVVALPSGAGAGFAIARVAAVAVPVAFGLFRLAREPADRFARLLLGAGALLSLTTLAESGSSGLYSLGRLSVWVVEAVLVYLILAFPHGRIESPGHRRLAVAAGALVALLYVPTALLAPFPEPSPWASCGTACPANAFQVTAGTATAVDELIRPARETLSVILFALVTLAVMRRLRTGSDILQRVLAPVAVVAAVRTVALAAYVITRSAGHVSPTAEALGWAYVLSLAALTLAFAAGLLADRLFVAGALEQLTRRLSSRPTAPELRETLAGALHDPALDIHFYAVESPSGWVDVAGVPAGPPVPGPNQRATEVRSGDRHLATIVHDAELTHDRDLLAGVVSCTVTALEHRQLVHELRSSLDELTASRARLVTVADEQRRKIERDLHDGAQQRLVAVQIKLALLADKLEEESADCADRVHSLERDITETLDEVRRFARGVYPPLLADRGLGDALHAVVRRAPLPTTIDARLPHRYPREVESAVYFACLEALQNVSKHARGATSVSIAISGNGRLRFDVRDNGAGFDPDATAGGAGLTNMRDRVGAVGGDIAITSRPGRGTTVTGVVPVH
jgi:signal transduction histidine kinase